MILYGWKFNSSCRMRCNERRDRPKIEARRLVERRGPSITDLLTLSTFSGVRAVQGRPVDVLFITDPVVRNDSIPSEYCVTIRDRFITRNIELSTEKTLSSNNGIAISKKNCSTAKTRCSTFHYCMASELIPLHYSQAAWGGRRPSLSRLLPISKTCVLFAPPFI